MAASRRYRKRLPQVRCACKKWQIAGQWFARWLVPGVTRFPDLAIKRDENHFVERTIRVTPLPPAEAVSARAAIIAAIPAKTGRVI